MKGSRMKRITMLFLNAFVGFAGLCSATDASDVYVVSQDQNEDGRECIFKFDGESGAYLNPYSRSRGAKRGNL